MPSRANLKNEVYGYRLHKTALLKRFPEIDDETLQDTLEGITDFHEIIAELVRSALVDKAMALGLTGRIEDMRNRLVRMETRAAKKRQLALDALIDADLKKLEKEDFTLTVRSGTPKLMIVSEDEIPEDYWTEQAPKLDRKGLMAALKEGQRIEGVSLNNPSPTLSVRTK